MFAAFFYLLRQRGLHVSLNEWMTLLEGMEKGLHHSTLTGFYHLCRAIVVKNETEFDRFDQIFLEFFKDVPYTGELPEDLLDWLNHPSEDLKRTIADLRAAGFPDETLEELLKMLEERLKEQTEEHNGGNYWVGTQGRTPWGNNGWHPNGIRIGGQSMHRTAMMVAGERKFRDFRKDNKLDTRQFQMAFRTLRQLSAQERSAEKELDVDATIHDTCESAGRLEIRYKNPRKNTVKVLLLMDSGGSMDYYSGLCSQLFQAFQGILCLNGLHSSQNSIHSNHNQNYRRTLCFPQEQGNHRRNNQDQHQKIFILLQKNLQTTFFLTFRKFIESEFFLPSFYFLIRQKILFPIQISAYSFYRFIVISFHRYHSSFTDPQQNPC